MEKRKEYWFDAREHKPNDSIIAAVYNLPYEVILVKPEYAKEFHPPSRMKVAVFANDIKEIQDLDKVDILVSGSLECLQMATKKGIKTAFYSVIKDAETLNKAREFSSNFDYAVVKLVDETNIPLELLIAEFQDTKTGILKEVKYAEDAAVALGVLEVGSGILISTDDVGELYALGGKIADMSKEKIELVEATVEEIKHIGMGERACIDTVSLMTKSEGMIIGSTSSGGILVCSEVHPLPYMNTRPFRVNAGAVHSYVWAPGNRTEYLTDLRVGKKVLCVSTDGTTRPITVGRIKTETRPLLLVKADAKNTDINVIVQDDWHVRVFGIDGKPKNVTALKKGDKLLAYVTPPGRHVGIKVDERIIEV